jgi:diguanylate cyclase (GGDEF)-like protein
VKHLEWFRWFAIATGILLFVAAMAFSHAVGVSSDALDRVMRYDWSTSGFQGRNEAAEFERRVMRLALWDDQSSLKATLRAHQILQSRTRSWGAGDFRRFLDQDPRLLAQYGLLVANMDSLGQTLQRLRDEPAATNVIAHAGAIAGAIERAGAIRRTVDRLGVRAYGHSLNETAKARDDLRSKQTVQKLLIVFLFAVGLILFLLTSWQKRSLARANAAIAGGARQLADSEERLSGVLANTTDGVMVLDPDWRITFANQKAVAMLFPDRAYLGERLWDLRRRDQTREFYKQYSRAMKQQCPVEFEAYLAPLDSWLEVHAFPTPDDLTVFFRDVTERRRLNDELVHLTRHDPLTDLANRTLFAERLSSGLECGRRRCELTLMMIDLDDFKIVNDLRGHQVGDRLLQQIAGRLAGLVRQQDTVARLGGDEFAIIQPGPVGPDGGAGVARRISEALRVPFDIEGSQVTLGASIGIAMAPGLGSRPEDLIHTADLALYRAKETKGTSLNYCVYEPAMEHHLQARQRHRLELRQGATQESRRDTADADGLSLHNARLTTALNHMSQGLCMFDADKKLIVCNERYAQIYGIPPEHVQPGTPFRQIVQGRIDSGQFMVGDPEDYLRERIEAVEEQFASVKYHHLTDGRTIAITHCPLEDGGWVATHDDMTDMQRMEARMAHMAHNDEPTDVPDRGAMTVEHASGPEEVTSQPEVRQASVDELNLHVARIMTALNHMSQGLCMFDADKRLIVCNEQYARMYGIPPEAARPGTHVRHILQGRLDSGQVKLGDPVDYVRERLAAIDECKELAEVHTLADGRMIALSHRPIEGGGWVATHDDITDIWHMEARMAHMAHHDELTDLPNRVLFRAELDRALQRGESLALLCLDLDQFKAVNDALGHPLGDALLRQAADRLRQAAAEGDLVARLGGDSFAILQRDAQIPETAGVLAESVLATMRQPYEVEGHQVVVGASIGIAGAPTDSGDADELLKMADMALYRCKSEGRGAYRFFEPDMDAKVQSRRGLEVDLRKALAGNELEIHYQPVVDIQADRVTGFEALLRWRHAVRGNVSPDEFVPLAEDIGVIGQLGAWVLERACAEAARWPADVRLAVNLSPAQFVHRDLLVDVLAALEHSGLPADRLELEITETVMLQDTGATLATLHGLRELGVHISLDDFGTGYSSLSFVRKFPFDRLKIDRSFIDDMNDNGGSLGIVRAVLALGHSQAMAITAEGVETIEQLERLRAEGCLEAQGYFFSPARPASEVAGLLSDAADRSRRGRPGAPVAGQGRQRTAHVKLVG